jgi:hypothetical protein
MNLTKIIILGIAATALLLGLWYHDYPMLFPLG